MSDVDPGQEPAPRQRLKPKRNEMKKAHLLAFVIAMAATPSFACTAEEATAKATEVSQKMQDLAAKDPQKATEVAQKISAAQSQAVTDLEGACKLYDDMLAELD
ncbi:hypothetical protein [Shinella zoogloeoides]|uniref:hypothetical protein n=1 Tax=Shinella zoogloeoides TaxID=352475 RepID=UPI0028A8BBA8|nr:hypothetical protein [Shinella zoogloeoides]